MVLRIAPSRYMMIVSWKAKQQKQKVMDMVMDTVMAIVTVMEDTVIIIEDELTKHIFKLSLISEYVHKNTALVKQNYIIYVLDCVVNNW